MTQQTGYLDVRGQRVWHAVHGSNGDPVVLLHGGFASADSWLLQAPALEAAGFQVFVPERRGHGRTPDVDGPITYGLMAEDTVSYLDDVVGRAAHLVGWSDGAVVALLVAMRRPDLVDRMVLIGQYFNSSGKVPGSTLLSMIASPEAEGFLRGMYDPYSPDGPEHFAVVRDKLLAMFGSEPEIDLADLASVTAPTLVLQGDRDEVTLAHSAEVADRLPDGRLAVIPGSHGLPIEQPKVVNELLVGFLRDGVPDPLM
ncbi:MAG TPA: alpha/beta hydrolase [Mycobacteriales bacterium]|nr:alpha/beta hydrolase [Mycobacteriales bacterium]HWA68022.1 alpha/beta hydrolase [Mycobacteriales bacterium]